MLRKFSVMVASSLCLFLSVEASALPAAGCKALPSHADLKKGLTEARKQNNGGLNYDMWATVVDRAGTVCAVAFSGNDAGSQWPGSRVISAQKANTANAFSLPNAALSTANLYSAVQPGGFLFGLQESNPVSTQVAYRGEPVQYGSEKDPMVGGVIGGVNVFGGGLALYNSAGEIVGGLGVSGDTSCADHNIAWRTRHTVKLDYVPSGVAPSKDDQIIYDIDGDDGSASGFGHPVCIGSENTIAGELPAVSKK